MLDSDSQLKRKTGMPPEQNQDNPNQSAVGTHSSARRRRSRFILAAVFLVVASCSGYYLVQFKIRSNFREVVPNMVYRSGQPAPEQLRRWLRKYDIQTVMSLRGETGALGEREQAVADESGVKMITFDLSAYSLPPQAILSEVIYELEHAQLPILIHCRHGVDRAGTISAIAAMALGHVEYDEAKEQAYVPPGPWKRRKGSIHISDLFALYEKYCSSNSLNRNDWQVFKNWVANEYETLMGDAGIGPATR